MDGIKTVYDIERGCGWRKEGGMYLISGQMKKECGRFPMEMTVCPTCSQGVKPSRGFSWIQPIDLVEHNYPGDVLRQSCDYCRGKGKILEADDFETCFECEGVGQKASFNPCAKSEPGQCSSCPMGFPIWRAGLIWVGGKFYKRPEDFTQESLAQGISRRITAIPKDFELNKTWVFLAHRNTSIKGERRPGIFGAIKPKRIEYVIKGTETQEEIEKMIDRGITPVKVERCSGPLEKQQLEEEAAAIDQTKGAIN